MSRGLPTWAMNKIRKVEGQTISDVLQEMALVTC